MSQRVVRALAPSLLLLLVLLAPREARAWVEVHVLGDDARVTLDAKGRALVEHRITLKIGGGPLRFLDIRGVEKDALPEGDGYVVPEREALAKSLASATPITADRVDPVEAKPGQDANLPTLHLRFDGSGVGRGTYVVVQRYRSDLAALGLVKADGAMTRVLWHGPIWEDGYQSARTTFVMPASPTAPRLDDTLTRATEDERGTGFNAPTFLSTVRRGPEKDEIEIVRPYAPSGEAIAWAIRIDPRIVAIAPPKAEEVALAPEGSPEAPKGKASPAANGSIRRLVLLGAIAFIFVLFSLLVATKSKQVSLHSKEAGVTPRPLLKAPTFVRAIGAALLLVAGLALQAKMQSGTPGSLLVALAAALAAYRTPLAKRSSSRLRGPGHWLSVTEEEAFGKPPRPKSAWLDASTRGGRILLFLGLCAMAAGAFLLAQRSAHHAVLLGLDAMVLLALFGTGRISELPPDPVVGPAPLLKDVARRVQKAMGKKREDLRMVPRIRVPNNTPDADELRLLLIPKSALPGFLGIEVGVVFAPGTGGHIRLPEVLLRVKRGTPCDVAIEGVARRGRTMRGRKPDERVIAFSPRLPTAQMTASMAAALAIRVTSRPETKAKAPEKKKLVARLRRAA